jgi:hypothetical protein
MRLVRLEERVHFAEHGTRRPACEQPAVRIVVTAITSFVRRGATSLGDQHLGLDTERISNGNPASRANS